ncbi:hypothetical protein [Haladaptatus pallidirubidus]|uniref:hypothetical protein n=1 Tax=Haladaptatus pallidirubidus TaxID=1008152 RepID=UPI0031E8460B
MHAWQYHEFGKADHGRTFARWTDTLDTTQHCERFTSPNWWVICEDCGGRLARYQHSKVVKHLRSTVAPITAGCSVLRKVTTTNRISFKYFSR